MKKLLVFLCILTCLFSLVSCDPGVKRLDKDELFANTVKIELVDYENGNPKLLRLKGKEKPKFDFNNATLIAALDESRFEDILKEVAEYDYLVFGTALNEPMGKTLILYQSNGNIIVLFGCTYTDDNNENFYYGDCNVFDSNGMFVEHIGDVGYQFGDMIESKYFQTAP